MDQATKIWNVVEGNPIAMDDESRAEECGETSPEILVIRTGKKFYRTPLPSTYKET